MGELADAVAAYRPRIERVSACPRNDLVSELEQVERQLQAVRESGSIAAGPGNVYTERDRLRREIAEAQVEFVFESVSHREWSDLLGKHQPTPQQRQQSPTLDHNPETFPLAAIVACLVSPREDTPEATEGAIRRIFEEWPPGETEQIWKACLTANKGVSQVPKWWSGSDTTGPSGQKSEPPSDSESLSPPS